MAWTEIAKIDLANQWVYTSTVAGSFFKITHLRPPSDGEFLLSQFDAQGERFNSTKVLAQVLPEIIYLPKPSIFTERKIGVRLLGNIPWSIVIEASDFVEGTNNFFFNLQETSSVDDDDYLVIWIQNQPYKVSLEVLLAGVQSTGSSYSVVTNGLTAQYKFNQGSGQQLTDSSGNNLHGTLGSNASAIDSQDPNWIDWADVGLSFIGDDFVRLPASNAWFIANSGFTLEVCAMLRSYQNWARLVDFGVGGTSTNNVYLTGSAQTTGKPVFGILEGNASTFVQSQNALPLNTFIYLQASFSNGVGRIYQNLALVAQGNLPTPAITNRTICYIGRSQYASDAYLDGVVALVRVYNRELTKTERINNYLASKAELNSKGIAL